jgi:hypothetical protein
MKKMIFTTVARSYDNIMNTNNMIAAMDPYINDFWVVSTPFVTWSGNSHDESVPGGTVTVVSVAAAAAPRIET